MLFQDTSSEMESSVWQAALAGLLHDVGKFSLRSGRGKNEMWDAEARRSIKYEHALASYGFVQQSVPPDWRAGLGGVAYHHNPQTLPDRWVQLADWMSSAERIEDEERQVPLLRSIFSRVRDFSNAWYWPLSRLKWTEPADLFPRQLDDTEWREAYRADYAALWDEFEAECVRHKLTADTTLSPIAYLENLLGVLYEFTWCIPSAYHSNAPDISLYDHARTTAALAACLAADKRDEAWCREVYVDLASDKPTHDAALLVGGDISGIQSFIYTIGSSGAAKSLRARSFYVDVLCHVAAYSVLDALKLPLTNLLYVGGGNFTLLAPLSVEPQLSEIAQRLADTLMETHQGELGLALAWERVPGNEFKSFGSVYDRLGTQLNRVKRQPFAQASATRLADQIGTPLTMGGALEFCQVTGDDWDVELRGDERKTRFVWSLEELGRQLPNATHLVLSRSVEAQTGRPSSWQEGVRRFGYEAAVVTGERDMGHNRATDLIRIWRLDSGNPRCAPNEEIILSQLSGAHAVVNEHPIANVTPRKANGEILTFDELAEDQATGIKRWGVLRIDVDNLGELFRNGLGDKASLSRISSLSSGLRLFFEGLLPRLVPAELKEKIYVQYSGGDDVFIVGAWDSLPEFARRVHEHFTKYTCENPAFSLSAGIAVVESKFPLYQAARLAEAAELASKAFTDPESHKSKNAVTFLGQTSSWQGFEQVHERTRRLEGWVNAHKVSKSLLQVILNLRDQIIMAQSRARRDGKTKPQFGRWTWMAAYQFTRMIDDKTEPSVKEGILEIQKSFLEPGDAGTQWGMAARWAQYLTREG